MEINRCVSSRRRVDGVDKGSENFDSYTAVYDGAVRERELGDIKVGPVTLVLATARGGALAGELAHVFFEWPCGSKPWGVEKSPRKLRGELERVNCCGSSVEVAVGRVARGTARLKKAARN